MTAVSMANYVMDMLFMKLYFRHSDKPGYPLWRRVLGWIFLLATWVLYPSGVFPFLSGMLQRFFLRIVLTLLCVLISFPISLSAAVYSVGYWCTMHLLVQSLFFSPFTYALFTGAAAFTGNPAMDMALCILLTFIVKGAVFGIFTALTPLLRVSPVQWTDLIPVMLVAVVALHCRELAIPLTLSVEGVLREISDYYLTLQFVLMALLVYMEFSRRFRRENSVMQLQKQVADALLTGIRNQNTNASAMAALKHDLKNHLISLSLLLKEGRKEESESYIASMMAQTEPVCKTYSTGNELVDGILSVKLEDAEARGVDVAVHLDMQSAGFLTNYDLCVLFGNVLDNAIEACERLSSDRRPYIRINGGQRANTLILRFENASVKPAMLVDGLPQTVKTNPSLHGFGLRNVSNVLKKYNGNLNISQSEDGAFILTMVIPVP